jgi:hypothetical protein
MGAREILDRALAIRRIADEVGSPDTARELLFIAEGYLDLAVRAADAAQVGRLIDWVRKLVKADRERLDS